MTLIIMDSCKDCLKLREDVNFELNNRGKLYLFRLLGNMKISCVTSVGQY